MDFGKEQMLSCLLLNHVASQIIDMISTLLVGAEVTFAEPTALQGTLVESLLETRPRRSKNRKNQGTDHHGWRRECGTSAD